MWSFCTAGTDVAIENFDVASPVDISGPLDITLAVSLALEDSYAGTYKFVE